MATSILLLIGAATLVRARAAEVVLYVASRVMSYQQVQVNVGDSVRWVQGDTSGLAVNTVVSFTGERASPYLTSTPAFGYIFEKPGFYAYRLFRFHSPPDYEPYPDIDNVRVGTVTVLSWSNAPPAVTINVPVTGSHFAWLDPKSKEPVPLLATVSAEFGEVDSLEFYAGTNRIGVVTNTPFAMTFTNAVFGTNTGLLD